MFCGFREGHVEKQQKNEKMKPKVRKHHTSKSDEPDLQESAFFKKIMAYQRKLLVGGEIFCSFVLTLYICSSTTGHVFTQCEQMLLTGSVDRGMEKFDSEAKI